VTELLSDIWTFACHFCDNGIRENEPYFCISRLHQVRGSNVEKEDEVLEACASLQICATCLSKAGRGKIKFFHKPPPLLKVEKEGLYRFAKYYASKDTAWGPVPKGRDSCTLCRAAIEIGDKYTLIAITKEQQHAWDVQIEEEYPLAVLCEACAEKYMVWLL